MAMLPPPVRQKGGKSLQRAFLTFGGDMPQRPGDFGIEVVNGMAWLVRALEADETQRKRGDAAEAIHIQRLMPADALRIRGPPQRRERALGPRAGQRRRAVRWGRCCTGCVSTRESRTAWSRWSPPPRSDGVEYF
jgi:hypothetical protein